MLVAIISFIGGFIGGFIGIILIKVFILKDDD